MHMLKQPDYITSGMEIFHMHILIVEDASFQMK